jgi:anti-sigma regulatory factor (Ser/Thr protein kinase)
MNATRDGVEVGRILVIDGGSDLGGVLPKSLSNRGLSYDFTPASDLDHRNLDEYAAFIVDCQVLDSNDLETLSRLKARYGGAKVIAVGSSRNPAIVASLMRHQIFSVLLRPLTQFRIAEVLDHALSADPWEGDIELLSGTDRWVQLRVTCKFSAAERAVQMLRELPGELDESQIEEFSTAAREMLMNAIEHGAKADPSKSIFLSYIWTATALIVFIRDPGPGFQMAGLTHAAVSNAEGSLAHADVRHQKGIRPGGFGILMARNLVDEMIYNERGNEVALIKHCRRAQAGPAA